MEKPYDREHVVENYARLCWKIASQLYRNCLNVRRLGDLEDVFQVAVLGLMEAAKRFDASRGIKFITYATVSIINTIYREAWSSGLIPVPNYHARALKGQEPPGPWTSQAQAALRPGRLPRCLREQLTDAEPDRADELLVERMAIIRRFVAELPARERTVLRKRFGFGSERGHTLTEVGKLLGVTRERARQIQVQALALLKTKLISELQRDHRRGPTAQGAARSL